LELVTAGFAAEETTGLGIASITPPLCARISTGEILADAECAGEDLVLIPGSLRPCPIPLRALPPVSEFPELRLSSSRRLFAL
jgi:hypothetical protein